MASLPLGATLGPEAPLIALGGGLALLFAWLARAPVTQQSTALLGAAGAAAALPSIFGNPLVGAVILIEMAGVGGPRLFAATLPALLSSGIGSLVFTGFGRWTAALGRRRMEQHVQCVPVVASPRGVRTGLAFISTPNRSVRPRLPAIARWDVLLPPGPDGSWLDLAGGGTRRPPPAVGLVAGGAEQVQDNGRSQQAPYESSLCTAVIRRVS